MGKTKHKTFQATLERMDSPLQWVIIRLPFHVAKVWGLRGKVKVKGEINGFAFRTSLFPTREGRHFLLVNKRMQSGGEVACGSIAKFVLEIDAAERTVSVPAEFKKYLAASRTLHRWFDKLSYSTRKDIADWITNVKSAEARQRRAEQIAERLLETMEAERELPPILQHAFTRDPRARDGWERMSATRRRGQLMAIFYYRNPEARARRVAKVVEEAVALGERVR